MIRHIFMGIAREGVSDEQLDELVAAWSGLKDKIEGVRAFSAGRNLSPRDRRWSVALVADFDDLDSWQHYIDHPEHVAVSQRLSQRLLEPDGRAAVQFEVS